MYFLIKTKYAYGEGTRKYLEESITKQFTIGKWQSNMYVPKGKFGQQVFHVRVIWRKTLRYILFTITDGLPALSVLIGL